MKTPFSLLFVFLFLLIGSLWSQNRTIAVIDFTSGDLQKKELSVLSGRFRTILVKTKAFDVLERDKMADILKEQDFVMSDNCNSAECAVQVGRLLGVELMVAGEVGKLGQTYSIDLRLIDVSTGKIIQSEAQDYKGEIDGLLGIMGNIANAFAGIKSDNLVTTSSGSNAIQSDGTFIDPRDGKVYKTVKIGNQIWMAENLNYETETGSWCYDNNPSNCDKYGRLYDWKTAKTLAPQGWHLPSKTEFETLLNNLGGSGANAYRQIIPGNASGFNALFGGWRGSSGNFYYVGRGAEFWSATEHVNTNVLSLSLRSESQSAYVMNYYESNAFSVRLVKD